MSSLPKLKGLASRAEITETHRPMFSHLKEDIPSGIVVFLVALPLCLGIALASGAPLISGLISGIIGGLVIGYISKSGTSVSGPAASVSAVVLVAIQSLGSFEVFLLSLVIAGLIQLVFGFLKGGLIADYIPTSIIKGLLAAIGLILITSQLRYAIGLDFNRQQHQELAVDFFGNFGSIFENIYQSISIGAIVLTLFSLFILIFWNKTPLKNFKLLPPALVVVILGVVLNLIFKYLVPGLYLEGIHLVNIPTIDSFSSLVTFPDFNAIGRVEVWTTAITVAVIASLSTLLNIEATDNIDTHKRKTPPNRELIAQGIGNTLAGLLGGIAITSVIVRSSVNIESGGQTKLSTILHGFLLLLSVVLLSSIINLIPLATLAAILLVVGYKLASIEVFKKIYRKGLDQFLPFVLTIVAILLTDVLIGVLIGSALSVFFLLRGNYYNPFFIENSKFIKGEGITLELSNEVSFLNKAAIKNTLWSLPDDSKVVIDATFSNYIDQDVLDTIDDFVSTVAKEHNIQVKTIGIKDHYDRKEEIEFKDSLIVKNKLPKTPQEVLNSLKKGSENFTGGNLTSRRLRKKELGDFLTSSPMAVVLNCIDLREPLNMLLNSGIGDLIPIRAAGNLVGRRLIHSIEISCRNQSAKLILLMGNSQNSLIMEALEAYINKEISPLHSLIEEALSQEQFSMKELKKMKLEEAADAVVQFNLRRSKDKIVSGSIFLKKEIKKGSIGIASAFYDRENTTIHFSELYSV